MARLAGGHDAALNDLMTRHGERLFHYLTRQLGNETEAEDCAQETFVRVYQHRAKFKPDAKFSTWLYTIATNLVRDIWRKRGRRPETTLDERLPDGGLSADEGLMQDERAAEVRRAVQALPEDLRAPLVLFEFENLAQTEIARILKCTPKAVEVRIYRARRRLRETLRLLSEHFGHDEDQDGAAQSPAQQQVN